MSFLSLSNGDRQILGTFGCTALAATIVGWIVLWVWLDERLGWPERYGHSRCHARNCWVDDLWHSPELLHRGNPLEWLLFALMWIPALIMIGVAVTPSRVWRRPTPRAPSQIIPE